MSQDDEAYRSLRSAIEAQGQNTPILVRPHPTKEGCYQVAFGHRRLRVALDIGRPVRAVVKEMNDQELILAQGQENSARADLSFIERARFARSLEKLGYSRDVITAALAVDKTALSRMIAVVTKIPAAAIEMIGPAHGVGRPRWLELANLFEGKDAPADLPVLRESEEFRRADSDARFDLVASFLVSGGKSGRTEGRQGQGTHAGRPRFDAQHWGPADGDRLVTMTHNARSSVIAVDRRHAPGFGEFILAQMDRLYVEYVATRPDEAPEK
jgi:ParB family chromosome partitioning protein